MFNEWARFYGRRGAHHWVPREETSDRWFIVLRLENGRHCIRDVCTFVKSCRWIRRFRRRWIISPEGEVLVCTSKNEPFITIDINLDEAIRAKQSYPSTFRSKLYFRDVAQNLFEGKRYKQNSEWMQRKLRWCSPANHSGLSSRRPGFKSRPEHAIILVEVPECFMGDDEVL